jgi:hypothetical protein
MAVWLTIPPCSQDDRDRSRLRELDGFRRQQFTGHDNRSGRQGLDWPRRRTSPSAALILRPTSRTSCSRCATCAWSSRCKRLTKSWITASSAFSTLTNSRPMCCLTRTAISFAIVEWADSSAANSTSLGSLKAVCWTRFKSWLDCSSAFAEPVCTLTRLPRAIWLDVATRICVRFHNRKSWRSHLHTLVKWEFLPNTTCEADSLLAVTIIPTVAVLRAVDGSFRVSPSWRDN